MLTMLPLVKSQPTLNVDRRAITKQVNGGVLEPSSRKKSNPKYKTQTYPMNGNCLGCPDLAFIRVGEQLVHTTPGGIRKEVTTLISCSFASGFHRHDVTVISNYQYKELETWKKENFLTHI
jgi:hypothetical protein